VSKANRQKGVVREKQRFVCWNHAIVHRGYVRFKHNDSWRDWKIHNETQHTPLIAPEPEWIHYDDEGSFVGGQEILVLD
jgi:hypothetical protein